MSFTIPSGIFTKYAEYADAMLSSSGFGVSCKLVYVDKITQSAISAPSVNKVASLNPSLNNSFVVGNDTYKMVETTADITLRVYWSQKEFAKFANVQVPEGGIMCIGRFSDLNLINKAKALLINTDKTGHVEWRFEKTAEPIVHGLDNNYLMSFWKRA